MPNIKNQYNCLYNYRASGCSYLDYAKQKDRLYIALGHVILVSST